MTIKSQVAPKSVKLDSAGGGESSMQPDPDPTVSGWPDKGQADTNARSGSDPATPGTNMQGAPNPTSATRAGEADTSKGYTTVKNVSTGNTDF